MDRKTRATQFEEETKTFLNKLEFKDVEGASDTFRINGNQVDACGGYDNTLLVIQCTMRQQLGKKTVRDKVKEVRGVIPLLNKGFNQHPNYKKYKNIRYVLATKHIDVRKVDLDYANETPRIYIWDDNFRAYYEDLYKKIKHYAVFNLLGEMSIKPSLQNTISVPAFLTSLDNIKMYSFFMDPKDLLEVSYVARRETKNERHYQRIIIKDKINKIAEYVNNKNILPNNLIISFGEHLRKYIKFHTLEKDFRGKCTSLAGLGISYGILEFPRDYRSCWIIDGQHRLYSFVNVKKLIYPMPIIAFENLNLEKQCKIFLDINKNQKPVDADLVWDLNGDMIPSEEDGIISNVVKTLNESGSLRYKYYIPSKGIKRKRGLLKMASACLSIKKARLCRKTTASKIENKLYDNNADIMVRKVSSHLSRYFACVNKLMSNNWGLGTKGFVVHDGGSSVMIRLFESILSRCITKNNDLPKESDYEYYLTPLANHFANKYADETKLKDLRRYVASEAGKNDILKEFLLHIRTETGDTLFGGEIDAPSANEIRKLERRLKELINNVLSKKVGDDWFESKVPEIIAKKALKQMNKYGERDKSKAYLHIIFGECINVIRHNRTVFYPLFKKRENCFSSDVAFEAALDFLARYKSTQTSHYVGVGKKSEDDTLFKIYYDQVNRCIDIIESEL